MRSNAVKSVLVRWAIFITALILVFCFLLLRARPIIVSYAQSKAKAIMVSAFDAAVKSAIESLDYKYGNIAVIVRDAEGFVCSIEIDYQKLNILRAEISRRIGDKLKNNEYGVISIPLGTLLGNEYLSGYGPSFDFRMRYSHVPVLDFESNFKSAGINSIFHQIVIKANLSCGVLILGASNDFSVDLSAVAAQTVINGAVPENFTNVIETPDSNVADDIFNFSN
ncbi:MAG: hypothetical protein IKZ59_03820 [Clostridia bacterium]|nr:hypothetical protein [Clostridia bacterium]